MPSDLPDSARLEWLWSEYEKQTAEAQQWAEEGLDIYPTPGLVMKTRLISAPTRPTPQFPPLTPEQVRSKMKFFVNLCSDAAIELPSMMQAPDGSEQLRVPISAGPVTLDVLKDGVTECLCCDIVLNPDSIAKATVERDFRQFISSFAIQKLEEKYKVKLADGDADIRWPKNLKYKGNTLAPRAQHIRRPKKAHLEEQKDGDEEDEKTREASVEERREAAKLARLEALRAAEERESGIQMSRSANRGGVGGLPAGEVFTSEEQAAKAAQVEPTLGGEAQLLQQQQQPPKKKIEVVSEERTKRSETAASAAASSSSAAAGESTAASPVPSHTISYLKSLSPEVSVPPSEWDIDLSSPPEAIRVAVVLPRVNKSSEEVEVIATNTGVEIVSRPEWAATHAYHLHMQFPFLLGEEATVCKFAKKTRTLTLEFPVVGKRDFEAEEAAAATAAEEAAEQERRNLVVVDWQDELRLTNSFIR